MNELISTNVIFFALVGLGIAVDTCWHRHRWVRSIPKAVSKFQFEIESRCPKLIKRLPSYHDLTELTRLGFELSWDTYFTESEIRELKQPKSLEN